MRINGVLRSLPLLRPFVVRMTHGAPSSVPPSVPPVASYCSTWADTQSHGLGSYSPVRGIDGVLSGGEDAHRTRNDSRRIASTRPPLRTMARTLGSPPCRTP